MKNKNMDVLREFYNAEAFLLNYEGNALVAVTENALLNLLCDIYDCDETGHLWEEINKASLLQTCDDEMLLKDMPMWKESVAAHLKLNILQTRKISKTSVLHPDIFPDDLKERADRGFKDACKLFAYLSWLGVLLNENRQVALHTWTILALSGDIASIHALVYAHAEMGNTEESSKWSHILQVLQNSYETFTPIAVASSNEAGRLSEVQTANLILFIRQTNANSENMILNRPMLHYLLTSHESFEQKMERLSSQTNYYLLMYPGEHAINRKCGF